MGSASGVEIISGAGSGAEVRSWLEARLLVGLGSGPGFVFVQILVVGAVVASELVDVGSGLKAISGSAPAQGFGS